MKTFLIVLGTILFFFYLLLAQNAPNIVLIFVDDMGYVDLGAYGQKLIRTKNIDALGREGMRFTDAYASTVCAPSRHMLLTGRDPGHAFSRGNSRVEFPQNNYSLGKILKKAGYKTAVIGKWGLGNPGSEGAPQNHGFDYAFGYMDHQSAHDYYMGAIYKNSTKIERMGIYSHTLFEREALSWLDEHSQEKFFLYLAFTIPHGDYQYPDFGPYEDQNWTKTEKTIGAMINRLDESIGKIVAKLESLNLREKTIIIFMSDNGSDHSAKTLNFNKTNPLRGHKRDLYEGGIRVPAIFSWPNKIPSGTVNSSPWAVWDMLPTLCDFANATCPKNIEGKSLRMVLLENQTQNRDLYWEFFQVWRGNEFKQAIRKGNWKGVRIYGKGEKPWGDIEMYDLGSDLSESKNVAALHPEIAKMMEQELIKKRVPTSGHPSPLDVHAFDWFTLNHNSSKQRLSSRKGVDLVDENNPWTHWHFESVGDGSYHLINRENKSALTVNQTGELSLSLQKSEKSTWKIGYKGDGWMYLIHVQSGKKLHANPNGSGLGLVDGKLDGISVQWALRPLEWMGAL